MRYIQLLLLRVGHELRRSDRGASLVEYALLVALVAIVCFVAVEFLGQSTSEGFSTYGESLTAAKGN